MITNSKWPIKYKKKLNTHQVIEQNIKGGGGILKDSVIWALIKYDSIDKNNVHYSTQHAILDSTLELLNGKCTPIDGGTEYSQKDFDIALERLNLLHQYVIEYKMYVKMNRIEKDFV